MRLSLTIPRAADDLQRELLRSADRQQAAQDWMFEDWWHQHLCHRLQQISEEPERDACLDSFQRACPFCEDMFPTQAALKIHAQRTHQHTDKSTITFNKSQHSVGGPPTCRYCEKQFSRWQTLAQHITQHHCPKHQPDLCTAVTHHLRAHAAAFD